VITGASGFIQLHWCSRQPWSRGPPDMAEAAVCQPLLFSCLPGPCGLWSGSANTRHLTARCEAWLDTNQCIACRCLL